MTLETRLRDYLEAQHEAVTPRADTYARVTRTGRRRLIWRRTGAALTGAAAVTLAVTATALLVNNRTAVAASPITGQQLVIINESPVVLQGQLGPEPDNSPLGADLTFVPIKEPSEADLEAIAQIIEQEKYTSPTVVSLGEIEAAQTRVYLIHDVDPETRSGRSTVVAVGADYPSFVAYGGRTEQGTWGPSGSRGIDGAGWVAIRIPEFASYAQVDVNGSIRWQRPADGFVWIPYTARPDDDVTVTGHDPTGRVFLDQTIDGRPAA